MIFHWIFIDLMEVKIVNHWRKMLYIQKVKGIQNLKSFFIEVNEPPRFPQYLRYIVGYLSISKMVKQ